MKLTLLGTGTPAPSLRRQSSGYVIEHDGDMLLLDQGPGATHRFLESGRSLTDVSHVFISHLHYDHIMDYPRVLLQRWDQGAGAIDDLRVFGPAPLKQITNQLIGPDGIYHPDISARVDHHASQDVFVSRGGMLPRTRPDPDVREVTAGDTIEGKSWRVTVGEAWHFQPQLECLAYRFDCEEGSVTYSGDSGGVLDSMFELATGTDVLIHMCHFESGTEPNAEFRKTNGSHMDVAEIAKRAGVKSVVLTHIVPGLDRPGVLERMVGEMRTVFNGRIIVGADLMTVPIKSTNHKGIE